MAGARKGEKRERDERRGVKDAQEMGSVGGADGQGREAQREKGVQRRAKESEKCAREEEKCAREREEGRER